MAKYLDPFKEGVTYPEFLKALGKQSIKEYCKGKLTDEQIEWLENDIKLVTNNK